MLDDNTSWQGLGKSLYRRKQWGIKRYLLYPLLLPLMALELFLMGRSQ